MKRADSSADVKRFPLRLCEVLQIEFVSVHGTGTAAPDWLLTAEDVDFPKLVALLRSPPSRPGAHAVDAVRRVLEAEGVRVAELQPGSSDAALLAALNALLKRGKDLFEPSLLACDAPARRLAELRAIEPKGPLCPAEQVQLNRALLEAAFDADVVARADTSRLARLYAQVHALEASGATHSALCLSGGGIRSASFALGVLQGLARGGVLDKFDYLSTVSGGGYVGSWLSTWIHRHPKGLTGVVAELSTHAQSEAGGVSAVTEPEPAPIRFLRSYSHFLNPRSGLLSADTWTWVAIYLRNLSVNWLALVPLLLLVLLVPRLYGGMMFDWWNSHNKLFPVFFWIATAAAIATLVCVTYNRPSISDRARQDTASNDKSMGDPEPFSERYKSQNWIVALGVVPLHVFAMLITLLIWGLPASTLPLTFEQLTALVVPRPTAPFSLDQVPSLLARVPWLDVPRLLAVYGFDHLWMWGELIVLASWAIAIAMLPKRAWSKRLKELAAMLVGGALAWYIVSELVSYPAEAAVSRDEVFRLWSFAIYPAHLYIILAIPAVALAALAGMTLFIGLVSKFYWIEDEDREWWGRFGAWTLAGAVAWASLSAIVILGPALLLEFPRLVTAVGGMSGLIAVILGKSSLSPASAKQSNTQGMAKQKVATLLGGNLLAALSLVFLVAFLAFLSLLTSAAIKEALEWLSAYPKPTGTLADLAGYFIGFDVHPLRHACGFATPWSDWREVGIFDDPQLHLEIACQTPFPMVVLLMALAAAPLVAAGFLVNHNKFSLHAAYRIRIVRTFLGASRGLDRKSNRFTDFDPMDNVQMHELQPGVLREGDIVDLPQFVAMLRQALTTKDETPAHYLARQLCSRESDRSGTLKEQLLQYKPGATLLKSFQRTLIEVMNRVLETSNLAAAQALKAQLESPAWVEETGGRIHRYEAHGNRIFANRLILQSAFPGQIRPYDFPPPPPHKLLHVLNLTLNLVKGGRLAWQERKAAPFVVTPMHSGSYYLGFRESRDYGGKDGVSIGTAAAISGAAVSPNMGYSSSPLTAALLTLFNVRLGWWLGNPGIAGTQTYRRSEPRFSLRPLLSEALGQADDCSPYVYLSDGGHFENTGLFEMVLRRCKLIVVSDAGADPDYQFADLGNAVRKIRIDLGISIQFDEMSIRKPGGRDGPRHYCAIGRIEYSAVDGPTVADGVLIVFKPVLVGNEPCDVRNYAAQDRLFPQQPTVDQFFGESQFESYRQLGYFAVRTVSSSRAQDADDRSWADSFIKAARVHLGHDDAALAPAYGKISPE